MSSFSCPHLDSNDENCMRLKTDCIPGRPGCVLTGKVSFAIPAKDRIKEKQEKKQQSISSINSFK